MRARFVKLTIAALVLVVVLAGALVAVALFVLDDQDYLDIAELALEEALGWTLAVRGPFSVDRSLSLALTGNDAVLTRGEERLGAAKQATFRLKLPSLLRGQFEFEVDVQEPDVLFAIDDAGNTSWNFEQFAEEGDVFPLEVVIGGIRLGKGQASVRDERSGTSLDLDLDEFVFQEIPGHYEVRFDFTSAYDGRGFRADGKILADFPFDTLSPDFAVELLKGSAESTVGAGAAASPAKEKEEPADVAAVRLTVAGKVVDPVGAQRADLDLSARMPNLSVLKKYVDELPLAVARLGPLKASGRFTGSAGTYGLEGIDATLGRAELQLEISGSLTELPDKPVAYLKTKVHASDLAKLSALLGTELPAVGPLDVAGDLELRKDSYELKGLKASLSRSDLAGSAALSMGEATPRLVADLSSRRLQLDEIFPTEKTGKIEEKKATSRDQAQRVFSDEPVPLDWLSVFNAQIRAHAQRVILYREFHDVRYTFDVDNGTLEFEQAVRLGDGSTNTRLRIDNRRSPPRFVFSDEANGVPLTVVLDLPEGIILGGKIDGRVRLAGRGNTPKALAASLDGDVLLEMGEARLVEAGLTNVSADLLSSILGSLSPSSSKKGKLSEDGYIDYRCGVLGIEVKEGMVRSARGIALESKKFNIGGDGYVDLRNETINFVIRPEAKGGLGVGVGTLLGGFAVGGTLSSPKVQVSRTGVAVAATVGPVLHILRDWATVDEFSCAKTLKRVKVSPAPLVSQ